MQLVYQYPLLISGKLVKRYKRFFADIELDSGEIITAHCPNTGPMIGVSTPGSLVRISYSDNPKRKLAYTWEMIQVNKTWVGVNTGLPNRVVKLGLEKGIFPQLKNYDRIRCEFPYGRDNKSRVDFLLNGDNNLKTVYLEVKNVTLAEENLALFPDTVTTRGQKHLRELMALLPESRAIMLYFINRGDCDRFAPADSYDRLYGKMLREAVEVGVEVLPYRFEITPQGISYLGLATLLAIS
jgi:sugar fermentation stimulation protein A